MSGSVSESADLPGVWSIMRPVQGRIRFAMGLAGVAAVCALGR
ncbi:hypothetical protein [Oceanospirillum linum]|nr:hypothetical protein [Oceanospirillum linum]SEG44038.1 ATP-binding cassette, subfamily B [Oleiphilus messinensis]SMP34264.1 hypothetical protein SAMN06264348_11116 [Oceanospirillum linum]